MSFVHTARRTTALLALVALGACSDSLGPTIDNIDAGAATAKVEPVMAVMEQAALESFASLGNVGGLPASASAASLRAVARLTSSAARGQWDAAAPLMARAAARSAADVIPPDVRGNLYTYNETTGAYEGAPSDAAPANGIRIMLYAWNPLAGEPSTPLTEIGYVDLIDESTAAQNALHVRLVATEGGTSTTLMDYTITHTVTATTESFSIEGEATNGTTPLTFDLSGSTNGTSATLTFDLAAASVGFSVHVGAQLNAQTEQATIAIALGYDGHSLTFDLSINGDDATGVIKFDGMRYATLSVTTEVSGGTTTTTTTFVKANGQPMTLEEVEQLEHLFERALNFGGFWEALLWPVGALQSGSV